MSRTRRPTPTEGAKTLAMHVVVFARKHECTVDLTLCEEIVSEYRGGHNGPWLQGQARVANPKTVLRYAKQESAR
jgi:hypothetical protein